MTREEEITAIAKYLETRGATRCPSNLEIATNSDGTIPYHLEYGSDQKTRLYQLCETWLDRARQLNERAAIEIHARRLGIAFPCLLGATCQAFLGSAIIAIAIRLRISPYRHAGRRR
jgi:hypothetical protein